jgi:hypothetical protein
MLHRYQARERGKSALLPITRDVNLPVHLARFFLQRLR